MCAEYKNLTYNTSIALITHIKLCRALHYNSPHLNNYRSAIVKLYHVASYTQMHI